MTKDAPEWFYDLVTGCTLAALCPPLPIPFFEDWGRNFLRRRIVSKILPEFKITTDARKIKILAGEVEEGCIQGCLWTGFRLFTYPWKVIRSILYVASARRRLAELSDLITRFYVLRGLLEIGSLAKALQQTDPGEVRRICRLLERIQGETGTGFSEVVFRLSLSEGGSWIRKTTREIGDLMRRMWKRTRNQEAADPQNEAETEEQKVRRYLPASFIEGLWSEKERLNPLREKVEAALVGQH